MFPRAAQGVYRGRGEREAFWDAFWSTFEDVQVEYHGFTEAGSEVVVANTAHIRGRQGIEVVARSTFVFTLENGRITRQRLFQERAEVFRSRRAAGVARASAFARKRALRRVAVALFVWRDSRGGQPLTQPPAVALTRLRERLVAPGRLLLLVHWG